jgi:hypothetical protein
VARRQRVHTKRFDHHRIGRVAAVVVAGSVFGVAGTLVLAAAERPAQPSPRQQEEARAAIAEWATRHHLTGLSPASLTALDRDLDPDACRAAELAAIAESALAEGLWGLSPASLRPVDD